MKKLILTTVSIFFVTISAYAQNYSIGISGTALYFDADGTETTKSSNETNSKSENGVFPMASLFIETEVDGGATVGLDIVPYGANAADGSNIRTDTDTDDASDTAGTNKVDVNFKNHIQLYIENPVDTGIAGSFVKFALNRVTVETDETMPTGSKYGDEDIMGITLGFGARGDLPSGDGAFYKVSAEVSAYEGATFNSTADADSVKNKIELDDFFTAGLRFSVGKSF